MRSSVSPGVTLYSQVDVSEDCTASIFRIEDYSMQITDKQRGFLRGFMSQTLLFFIIN
jgi:hypothetical protein